MTELQICDILPCSEEMTTSISLTGITTLTKTRYRSRHSTCKEVVQVPKKGFMLRKEVEGNYNKPAKTKKRKVTTNTTVETLPTIIKKKQSYTINKKQVWHRLFQFINQQKGMKELYFWTVTFPQGTEDDTCFICFNKWLTRLRTLNMLKSYLWVTERQANGTLHYHIAIPHRMDVKKANRFMRACLLTCIDEGLINWSKFQAINYNGVDISKHRTTKRVTNFAKGSNQKSLVRYITKYATKNNEEFTHFAWHCSRDFSNLIISVHCTNKELDNTDFTQYVDTAKPLIGEFYTFLRWKKKPPPLVEQYFSMINNKILTIINN